MVVLSNKTFGVSIDELLRKTEGCDVPPIVTTIVEFLEKYGQQIICYYWNDCKKNAITILC